MVFPTQTIVPQGLLRNKPSVGNDIISKVGHFCMHMAGQISMPIDKPCTIRIFPYETGKKNSGSP
jgi:hypothetical protein